MKHDFQGKRPDQVEFSQKVGGFALLAFVAVLIVTAILEVIVKYK
jgi:hypothetical protein